MDFLASLYRHVKAFGKKNSLSTSEVKDFVDSFYQILLGRPPDAAGAQHYESVIQRHGAGPAAIARALSSFLKSEEYRAHRYVTSPGVAAPRRRMFKAGRLRIPFTPEIHERQARGLSVLLVGTCQVAALVDIGQRLGHGVKHMLLDPDPHQGMPSIDTSGFDAVVLSLTLRHIFGSDMTLARLANGTKDQVVEVLTRASELMTDKLSFARQALPDVPIFIASFLEPSFNYGGNLLNASDPASPRQVIRELNGRLADLVYKLPNCYIVDFNDIANSVGRMHLHDDVVAGSLHASFIDEGTGHDQGRLVAPVSNRAIFEYHRYRDAFGELFWRLISDNLDILQQQNPVKLIVVDLDDTLWRGVAAEDTLESWKRVEGWPIGFVESLLFFKSRGGLLAICSKNDREPTLKRLQDIWGASITENDFVSMQINWESKSENLSAISKKTNILMQNILFIDDNPRELDEVQARFPEVRVLRTRHIDWRRVVLRSPETQVSAVTNESSRRTDLVKASAVRDAAVTGLSRREWLASLNLRERVATICSASSTDGKRAFELLNKTNQFNTTGKRWTVAEFEEFLSSKGVCLVARLTDRNIDNGIVGVALVKRGEIVQIVLSCRVFGLGAEVALASVAISVALRMKNKATGRIVDTGKNFTCHKFFEEVGFCRNGEHFETERSCTVPDWIELTSDISMLTPELQPI